ncbi:MAG: group 1 glycosyl transferase [Leptolyngbya sp.]|nr:MAG: group 1 glycosyl transferase [Leptolyngbya sp.]
MFQPLSISQAKGSLTEQRQLSKANASTLTQSYPDCQNLRILIVAEHASMKFGGEAALPVHYFRELRQRKIETWLVVHERTREELLTYFPTDCDRIYFVPDTRWHRLLSSIGKYLPRKISEITFGFAMTMLTQFYQRRLIKKLVQNKQVDVIHQPIFVSPKIPSLIFGMSAPVVIGPMNGGMTFPPAFRYQEGRAVTLAVSLGRLLSNLLNTLIPGKKLAATLLVANQRTWKALPAGVKGKVFELVENGVDMSLWQSKFSSQTTLNASTPSSNASNKIGKSSDAQRELQPIKFIFMGRLLGWKGLDLLLPAFKQVLEQLPATLEIIGDGAAQNSLMQLAVELDLTDEQGGDGDRDRRPAVQFLGWLPQKECAYRLQAADILVLPSLFECGGAVVLEAMATGLPVIATNWGGPIDYLDESCGILVSPQSREEFIHDLAGAMLKLAESPALREKMGRTGRHRVLTHFDWQKKIDTILRIYAETVHRVRVSA